MLDHATKGPEDIAPAIDTPVDALAPPNSHTITYQSLLERYSAESKPSQDRSAAVHLRKWLNRWKKDLADPVGSELHFEFDRCFAAFRGTLDRIEKTDKSAHNAASVIRGMHRTYITWLDGSDLPADFSGALLKAMAIAGLSQREVIRRYRAEYGGELPQLNSWVKGRTTPNYARTWRTGRKVVERLETLLHTQPGALSTRAFANAPRVLLEPSDKPNAFRDHHSMLVNDKKMFPRYMLHPLPPHLEKDFAALEAWRRMDSHYVASNPPGDRNVTVVEKERWNSAKTVNLYRAEFEAFFGFLCLPATVTIPDELPKGLGPTVDERKRRYLTMCTGMGFKPKDLRFTMLVDHELVRRYVQFRKARNVYQGTTVSVVGQVIRHNSLLAKKDIAFFRGRPDFGAECSPPIKKASWAKWCDAHHGEMRDLINALGKIQLKTRTREPDEPVRHVFAQKHPLMVLIDLARHLLKTLPPASCPLFRALQYRNATLVLLMTYEPLRAGHWRTLRLGTHIYKDEGSGVWVIDVKARDFKNWIWGYARDRYRKLPAKLGAIVATYVKDYRPLLYQGNGTDLFLLKSKMGSTVSVRPDPAMSENGFYNLIADLLQKYLGVPVGPHVIRHILTTDYLRKHHGDYEGAAAVLNDAPETVRRNYSHVTQLDFLETRDEEHDSFYEGLD